MQNARLRQQVALERAHRNDIQQREMQLQKKLDQQRGSDTATEQELAQVRQERARLEEELKESGKATDKRNRHCFICYNTTDERWRASSISLDFRQHQSRDNAVEP